MVDSGAELRKRLALMVFVGRYWFTFDGLVTAWTWSLSTRPEPAPACSGPSLVSSGRVVRRGPSASVTSGDCPGPATAGCSRPRPVAVAVAVDSLSSRAANMRACAGTPRPLTRSTTCVSCRLVTSTPGMARSTHVRLVGSRWSLLGLGGEQGSAVLRRPGLVLVDDALVPAVPVGHRARVGGAR